MDPERLLNLQKELLRLQHSLFRVTAEVESLAIESRSSNSAPTQPRESIAILQYKRRYLARRVHQQVIDAGALLPVDSHGFIFENEEVVFGEGADPSVTPILRFSGVDQPVNLLLSQVRFRSPPRRPAAAPIPPLSAVDTHSHSHRHPSYRVSEDHRAARRLARNWSEDRASSKRKSLKPPDTK